MVKKLVSRDQRKNNNLPEIEPVETHVESIEKTMLKNLVSTFYQIQKLRIQFGNRITAHFYRKLGIDQTKTLLEQRQGSNKTKVELIDVLKADWNRITDAFVDSESSMKLKRKSPTTSTISEATKVKLFLNLPDNVRGVYDDILEHNFMSKYRDLVLTENSINRDMLACLEKFQIWNDWLSDIKGVGPTIGAVMLSTIDIHKADTPSSLWSYCGLDCVPFDCNGDPDGRGRGRYKEHLIDVEYTTRTGEQATKKSITFNPFLKTKLVGVLGDIMIKHRTPKYRDEYDNYKNRIIEREHGLLQVAKQSDVEYTPRTPAHINRMAVRYMIKRFLVDFYCVYREMEGLPIVEEYGIRKLHMVHHSAKGQWARRVIPPTESDETPPIF